jgi:hypothetical protein
MARRDDFLIGRKEKAVEAIKAGKTKEALGYLNEVYEQFHALPDTYCSHLSWRVDSDGYSKGQILFLWEKLIEGQTH